MVARHLVGALCIFAFVSGCSTRYLRPPPAPERVFLSLPDPPRPPAEDEGTVSIDVTDGPSRVELITQRTEMLSPGGWSTRGRQWQAAQPVAGLQTRPLCLSPCTVNLPRGDHELLLTHADPAEGMTSSAFVRVGPRPSVFRHTLGRQETSVGGLVGALLLGSFGISALLTGGVLMLIGNDETSGTDLRPAGGITLGIGAAMSLGAWLLGEASRPTVRPGATTQWTP